MAVEITSAGVEQSVLDLLQERLGDRPTRPSQDFLRAAADMGADRLEAYSTASDYYDGDQDTLLTDREKKYLERSGLDYCENFCETVVDALAERLNVVGVSTDLIDQPGDDPLEQPEDGLAEWLWDTFDANRGDELQATVHTETTKLGDGFVLVEFDPEMGRPAMTWNEPRLLKPEYHDGSLAWISKTWTTDAKSPTNPKGIAVRRLNIYYPDRVEKWFTVGNDQQSNWVEWLDDGDEVWPTPWVGSDQKPLGIPVFHFTNNRASSGFGKAEHRGTIPQQDRLNKELIDLSAVLDHQGYPQRYAQGVADTSKLTTDPGVVWSSDNPTASFGQFPAADPSGPIKAIESTLIRIATRSRTPAHLIYLSGGLPSGESLKTAESGLVAKAKKRAIYHGGVWAEVFRMCGLVAITFGSPEERPAYTLEDVRKARINVRWQDPETRNEKEHLESLVLMSTLGVSTDTLLSMIPGIDPAEERDKKEANGASAGEALLMGALNPANVMPAPGE